MRHLVLISVISLLMAGGCITKSGDNDNGPIVSPTNISTEVHSDSDKVLPQYVPWWARGEDNQ